MSADIVDKIKTFYFKKEFLLVSILAAAFFICYGKLIPTEMGKCGEIVKFSDNFHANPNRNH